MVQAAGGSYKKLVHAAERKSTAAPSDAFAKNHLGLLMERWHVGGVEVRERLKDRYSNIALVSALVFTVAAGAIMTPSDRDISTHADMFGILSGAAFVFTLISVMFSIMLLNVACLIPAHLMPWFLHRTHHIQKAPQLAMIAGSLCLTGALGVHIYANLGMPSFYAFTGGMILSVPLTTAVYVWLLKETFKIMQNQTPDMVGNSPICHDRELSRHSSEHDREDDEAEEDEEEEEQEEEVLTR